MSVAKRKLEIGLDWLPETWGAAVEDLGTLGSMLMRSYVVVALVAIALLTLGIKTYDYRLIEAGQFTLLLILVIQGGARR